MNSLTEKIWDYIDGNCSAEERRRIDHLIQHDEEYKRTYNELMQLHNEFGAIELDEPPMAFTNKVMEQIRAQQASVPLKTGVNKYIIWGVASLFIGTILVLLLVVCSHIGQSTIHPSSQISRFSLGHPEKYFTGAWLNGFLLFDVVLGMFLFDAYLRRHRQFSHKY